jgi:hypothetical protein
VAVLCVFLRDFACLRQSVFNRQKIFLIASKTLTKSNGLFAQANGRFLFCDHCTPPFEIPFNGKTARAGYALAAVRAILRPARFACVSSHSSTAARENLIYRPMR